MKAKPTPQNPYGLSYKQALVIEDVKAKLARGQSMDLSGSVAKIYGAKPKYTPNMVASINKLPNFREALIASLTEKGVLGANGKVESVLRDGLDALDKDGNVAHETRLKYAQELNKISGVYAPERKATLNLNLDMPEEDLNKHIDDLQDQLE